VKQIAADGHFCSTLLAMKSYNHATDRQRAKPGKSNVHKTTRKAKYFRQYSFYLQEENMVKLKAGDKAPFIELSNQDNTTRKLSDFSGRKILIFFYPKAGTSG
jgi:hypothetical protein